MRASPGLRLSASFIEQPAALLLMAGVLMMRGGGGGSTGGMVKAKKKGEAGPSVNYVTRNKAIRTLQISLKDFRRLCILKGIYPRDPPKKKHGKDKTYYHIKDIKFLRHEPLLNELRSDKIRLRKLKRAQGKKDHARVAALKAAKPKFKVDHIIKERYPTFLDALRDLDDALCMVHLFASLPTKTVAYHDSAVSETCTRLVREFQSYVFATHSLRKMFVSIKGMYYQAEIMGQTITWLVPHKFAPNLPADVDYRVMLTFLEFYTTLMKFVLFKLYFEMGWKYPPLVDSTKDSKGEGLNLFKFESLKQQASAAVTATSLKPATATAAAGGGAAPALKDGTKAIGGVLKKIVAKTTGGAGAGAGADDTAAAVADAAAEQAAAAADDATGGADTQLFQSMDREQTELTPAAAEELKVKKLFAGLTFYLAREVPGDVLEFVLLNGGARVLREDMNANALNATTTKTNDKTGTTTTAAAPNVAADPSITHHVIDRPLQSHRLLTREYVQPQWVFDSFNTRALLPTTPYAPGVVPPPHLSPFVDDEKEGYVPKQRAVLQQWGAAAATAAAGGSAGSGGATASVAMDDGNGNDDEDDGDGGDEFGGDESDNDHDLEQDELDAQEDAAEDAKTVAAAASAKPKSAAATYAQNLSAAVKKQSAPATAAAAAPQVADGGDDAGSDDGSEGDDGDGEGEEDEPEMEVESKVAAAAGNKKRKSGVGAANDEAERAKIMMGKKDARLYHRMQHGIQKKADANAALESRRQQIELAAAGKAKSAAAAGPKRKKQKN